MSLDYSPERREMVLDSWDRWIDHKLGRPIIDVAVSGGKAPGRPAPRREVNTRFLQFAGDASAEEIIDCIDYGLSKNLYPGDAYPAFWPNYGAGVLAAYMGAKVDPREDGNTVWFHPPREREAADIHLKLDPENEWFRHTLAVKQAAMDRWGGAVQVAMTDLGGNLDILASFRPGEKLLLDLYDCPEQVERQMWEAHEAWFEAWDAFNAVLQPGNMGYSAWAGVLCSRPHYMLQCDFCYMIGPEMFERFVKPELAACCRKIPKAFYHLDGVGQLAHLDSLLEIDQLAGVQWIPGDGQPDCRHWPEVYRKIHAAGKLIQVFPPQQDGRSCLEVLDIIADQIGAAEPICLIAAISPEQRGDLDAMLTRHGAE